MKYSKLFILSFLITFSVNAFSQESPPATAKSSHKSTNSKDAPKGPTRISDPALKRGYELGFDFGMKAGKADKKENKKANPSTNEDYKMANKRFRHEYGSETRFILGYQSGFTKGYKVGYGGANPKDLKENKKSKNPDSNQNLFGNKEVQPSQKPAKTDTAVSKPKVKSYSPSEDAL